MRPGSGTTTIREQGDAIKLTPPRHRQCRLFVAARTNPKPEFGLALCIVAPRQRVNWRHQFAPAAFNETANARLIDCADNNDCFIIMHRIRHARAGNDALLSCCCCLRIERLIQLLLRCLSEIQSRCSVDWRVISEVEVDGKIKANCRLLEAIVCTLVLS